MNLLNQKCNIQRLTTSKNQYKQTVKNWNTIAFDVKCNIQYESVKSGDLKQSNSGLQTSGQFVGFFDADADLAKGDRIVWSCMYLYVKGIPFPVYGSGNTIHHKEALMAVEET